MRGRVRVGLAMLAVGVLGAGVVSAQTDIEVNAGVQFNFVRPGARSLAMGGAAAGLDGDTSAAFSNPAGLTTLKRPEVAAEARSWRYTSLFTDKGRLNGAPTGTGIDTISGIVAGESKSDTSGLSHAAIVVPAGHWGFGLFYVTNDKFTANYSTQGAIAGITRLFPTANTYDFELKDYGGSIAYRIGNIASIGVGVMRYEMTFSSQTKRYDFSSICTVCDQPGQSFGVPNFASTNLNNQQTQDGSGQKWTYTFGFTEKLGEKIRVGYAYRKGPKFTFKGVNRGGIEFNNESSIFSSANATFHIPDVLSLGASFRPSPATTIAFEYKRVRYSLLGDGFTLLLDYPQPGPSPANFKADDASEFHLGFEHVLGHDGKSPVALRAGGWYDPQHNLYFDGATSVAAGVPSTRFPKRDSYFHGSGGIGVLVSEHLQLDAAVDVSKRVSTGAVSAAIIF